MRRRNPQPAGRQTFRATCTAAETVGKAVYVAGPETDGAYPVRLADCTRWDRMPAVGIVVRKASDTECWVQRSGLLPRGTVSGLEPGKTYKVDPTGGLTRWAPAPGITGYAVVQFVGVAWEADVFEVRVEYDLKVNR